MRRTLELEHLTLHMDVMPSDYEHMLQEKLSLTTIMMEVRDFFVKGHPHIGTMAIVHTVTDKSWTRAGKEHVSGRYLTLPIRRYREHGKYVYVVSVGRVEGWYDQRQEPRPMKPYS